jgi:Domain of unknown function DUF11
VIGSRLRGRRSGAILAATLFIIAAMPGLATAANPSWSIKIVKLPPSVVSGQDAGYRVTVANAGPSNINGLSLSTNIAAPVTYFSGLSQPPFATGPASCAYVNVPFTCNLGTMNAGQSTTFTIAYKTSGSGTFDMTVSLRSSSGDTGSDGKGQSRGDALSVTAKTGLDSGNFAGGYFQANTTLQTNPNLGRNNKQSTSLVGFAASASNPYDVMIRDGSTILPTDATDPNFGLVCDNPVCSSLTSEWSLINLQEGQTQGTAFHVTLVVDGSLIPGGTAESDIVLVHVWLDALGASHTEVIGASGVRCTPSTGTPTNPECITVTKVGPNWKVDAWLFHNGGMKI